MDPTRLKPSGLATNGLPSLKPAIANDPSIGADMVPNTLPLARSKPSVIFNGLLSVEEANSLFKEHEMIPKLLCPFDGPAAKKFGIALLHRHAELREDEVMVCHPVDADGVTVTQPEMIVKTDDPTHVYVRLEKDEHPVPVYPSSWLVAWPHEVAPPEIFAVEYSLSPDPIPDTLVQHFAVLLRGSMVPTFNHAELHTQVPILGLGSCPQPLPEGKIYSERTEGRKNIVTIETVLPSPGSDEPATAILTLWTADGINCICKTARHSGSQLCNPCSKKGKKATPKSPTDTTDNVPRGPLN